MLTILSFTPKVKSQSSNVDLDFPVVTVEPTLFTLIFDEPGYPSYTDYAPWITIGEVNDLYINIFRSYDNTNWTYLQNSYPTGFYDYDPSISLLYNRDYEHWAGEVVHYSVNFVLITNDIEYFGPFTYVDYIRPSYNDTPTNVVVVKDDDNLDVIWTNPNHTIDYAEVWSLVPEEGTNWIQIKTLFPKNGNPPYKYVNKHDYDDIKHDHHTIQFKVRLGNEWGVGPFSTPSTPYNFRKPK